jgi:hypothetical protein
MGDLIQLKTMAPQQAPEPEEEDAPEAGADWESAQTSP